MRGAISSVDLLSMAAGSDIRFEGYMHSFVIMLDSTPSYPLRQILPEIDAEIGSMTGISRPLRLYKPPGQVA
jgi:hypothetical protein